MLELSLNTIFAPKLTFGVYYAMQTDPPSDGDFYDMDMSDSHVNSPCAPYPSNPPSPMIVNTTIPSPSPLTVNPAIQTTEGSTDCMEESPQCSQGHPAQDLILSQTKLVQCGSPFLPRKEFYRFFILKVRNRNKTPSRFANLLKLVVP